MELAKVLKGVRSDSGMDVPGLVMESVIGLLTQVINIIGAYYISVTENCEAKGRTDLAKARRRLRVGGCDFLYALYNGIKLHPSSGIEVGSVLRASESKTWDSPSPKLEAETLHSSLDL